MLRRIAPAVLATAVLAVGLTGCGQAAAPEVDRGDCVSDIGPGAVSDSVVVLGGFGQKPEVKIPEDALVAASQRTIVDSSGVTGTPKLVTNNSIASVNFAFYDQATGKELLTSDGFAGKAPSREFFAITDQATNPINEALKCAAVGERLVLALSPQDAAPLLQQFGSTSTDGIVALFDVEGVNGFAAEGSVKGLPSGFPAVVTNDEGRPGVVLPPVKAPEGLTSAVRIAGDGDTITKDERVIVQLLSVSWDGRELTNTWAQGGPQAVGGEDAAAQQGMNFRAELTGKKVGSQVVITEGGDNALVYVVDVLAAG